MGALRGLRNGDSRNAAKTVKLTGETPNKLGDVGGVRLTYSGIQGRRPT